jgi:dienelactone hydrolase
MLVVNGATALGNDDPETKRLAEALARAGYLVMLPQLGFLTGARLERAAPSRIDAAFAVLLSRPNVERERVGAFGFSVGGGVLLAAAGRAGSSLASAQYLGVLGAFFDVDTYLASVVSGQQRRGGVLVGWTPDPEARLKLPLGAAGALPDGQDRTRLESALMATGGVLGEPPAGVQGDAAALWHALAARDYDSALARLAALPPALRETFDALSPSVVWSEIRAPVYWLHDDGDRFEPVAEAEAAAARSRPAPTVLYETRLLSHAAALSGDARSRGLDFWVPEITGLLGFAVDVLRRAG